MSSLQARIARQAHVSQSTVSRALRNHPGLPRETCERIQAIAREEGYIPNALITSIFSAMRRQHHQGTLGTLAFLTAHPTRHGWRNVGTYLDFFTGAQARALAQGFALEIHWAAASQMAGSRLSDILQTRGIRGLILSGRGPREAFPDLKWDRFALVRIGLSQARLPVHCAVNHQYKTIRLVAANLAARGYRRIGLAITAWQNEACEQFWQAGFLIWQQSQPGAARIPPLIERQLSAASLHLWYRTHRPDAVIAVNPDVLELLRAGGVRVPGDAGFALLDRHEAYGDVAGADQDNRRVGAIAVDILLAQLGNNERGIPAYPQTVLVESSWREGGTVRPPPAPSPA